MYVRDRTKVVQYGLCSVDGCELGPDKPSKMCTQHLLFDRKYGNPFADGVRIPKPSDGKCVFPKCNAEYHLRTLCASHHRAIIEVPRKIHRAKIAKKEKDIRDYAKRRPQTVMKKSLTLVAEGNDVPIENIAKVVGKQLKAIRCEVSRQSPIIRLYFMALPQKSKINEVLKRASEQDIKIALLDEYVEKAQAR